MTATQPSKLVPSQSHAVLPRDNKMGAKKTYRTSDSFIGSKTIIGTAYFGTEERRLICVSVQLYIADFVSTYTSERDVSSRY